jgi:hypothetical protein
VVVIDRVSGLTCVGEANQAIERILRCIRVCAGSLVAQVSGHGLADEHGHTRTAAARLILQFPVGSGGKPQVGGGVGRHERTLPRHGDIDNGEDLAF